MIEGGGSGGWTRLQLLVVILCTAINALDGMDVIIISIVAQPLTQDWNIGFAALGLVFSAGLFGMMVGSLLIAPFADRFGRRPLVLAALGLLTVGMIGTGLVSSIEPFILFRALAGMAIGALLASVAALSSEFAPEGKRSIAIGWFQAGYPLGAILTGLAALWVIPAWGWQAALIAAGCCGALLLPVIWLWLPESPAFLESRNAPVPATEGRHSVPLAHLFAPDMWQRTLTLWGATLCGFAVLYFVTSWITKLSAMAGLAQSDAIWATTIYNVGGLAGGLAIGWMATRRPVGYLILGFFIAAAALLILFGSGIGLGMLLIVAGVLGFALQGGFTGFYSLAAGIYPVAIRGSGIGWAIGIGRGGSIVSPLAGAWLLGQELPLWAVFVCFAVPLILAGLLATQVERLTQVFGTRSAI